MILVDLNTMEILNENNIEDRSFAIKLDIYDLKDIISISSMEDLDFSHFKDTLKPLMYQANFIFFVSNNQIQILKKR